MAENRTCFAPIVRRTPFQIKGLESDILKRVRASEGVSRAELARDLGLAPSTAGVYVERLIAERFLLETEVTTGDAGRPPRILRPNPEGGEFVGVDFEARNVMAVAVDFSDRPLRNARRQINPDDSAEQVVRKIEEVIEEVRPKSGSQLLAIGVGVPGLVDSAKGVGVLYKYIRKWENVPLAKTLADRFKVPVFLENNARSMALAELWFGQGKGLEDFLCVGIRSGIGVGLVLNGRLYCGAHHAAGELGRWRSPFMAGDAPKRTPGAEAGEFSEGPELQDVASVRALLETLKGAIGHGKKSLLAGKGTSLTVADLVGACQQRDPLALRAVADAANALGWAIGQLTLIVDPAKIVLAGPLTALGETLLQPMRLRVGQMLQPTGMQVPEMVNSTMGEFSGALGAAALALHQWEPRGANH